MNTPDAATYLLFAATACIGLPVLLVWVRNALRVADDKERFVALRTERLMRRFIVFPTQSNYSAVWRFVRDNDVRLSSMDWEVVRSFTLASMKTNFTCDA
jgi:hypothetical protein